MVKSKTVTGHARICDSCGKSVARAHIARHKRTGICKLLRVGTPKKIKRTLRGGGKWNRKRYFKRKAKCIYCETVVVAHTMKEHRKSLKCVAARMAKLSLQKPVPMDIDS